MTFYNDVAGGLADSGAEYGGPSYTKDVVENLPQVGKDGQELLKRELDALNSGKKSSFVRESMPKVMQLLKFL